MWLVQVCRNSLFHIGFLLIEKFLQVDAVNVDVLDFEGSLNSFAGSGGLHLGFCSSSALLFLHQKKNKDMFSIFYQKCKKKIYSFVWSIWIFICTLQVLFLHLLEVVLVDQVPLKLSMA